MTPSWRTREVPSLARRTVGTLGRVSVTPRYIRRSARILLVDRAGRILLFNFADQVEGNIWITPGGGVDDGEALAAAAARELREETGLVVAAEVLGSPVAYTGGHADLGWAKGTFRDDYFFHRVDAHTVDASGMESHESGTIIGHRWWTVDEITKTDEVVFPFGLAGLLTDLLAGRVPERSVELPWHH
jgi:8-oxo-dGTP pyrophosphatase MutT (NUDIX family)